LSETAGVRCGNRPLQKPAFGVAYPISILARVTCDVGRNAFCLPWLG